jgi:hypothetical protein
LYLIRIVLFSYTDHSTGSQRTRKVLPDGGCGAQGQAVCKASKVAHGSWEDFLTTLSGPQRPVGWTVMLSNDLEHQRTKEEASDTEAAQLNPIGSDDP